MHPLITAAEPPPEKTPIIYDVLSWAHTLADCPVDEYVDCLREIQRRTSGRDRWTAARYVLPGHPDYAVFTAMLNALISLDRSLVWTKAGWFTRDELKAYETATEWHGEETDLHELIVFPYSYPWRSKPDEQGNGGDRAPARHRQPHQRSPRLTTFTTVVPAEKAEKEERGIWT